MLLLLKTKSSCSPSELLHQCLLVLVLLPSTPGSRSLPAFIAFQSPQCLFAPYPLFCPLQPETLWRGVLTSSLSSFFPRPCHFCCPLSCSVVPCLLFFALSLVHMLTCSAPSLLVSETLPITPFAYSSMSVHVPASGLSPSSHQSLPISCCQPRLCVCTVAVCPLSSRLSLQIACFSLLSLDLTMAASSPSAAQLP